MAPPSARTAARIADAAASSVAATASSGDRNRTSGDSPGGGAGTLPTGTSYAVWVGIGAALTVLFGMVTGEESVSVVKALLLLGLIGCVVGLKLAH